MPPADLELSTFRVTGFEEPAIWLLGREEVALPRRQKLHARADLVAKDVSAIGLSMRPDKKPEHHVSLLGWPTDTSTQQLLATELAAKATLRVPTVTG